MVKEKDEKAFAQWSVGVRESEIKEVVGFADG
jgi:hypothetical protein